MKKNAGATDREFCDPFYGLQSTHDETNISLKNVNIDLLNDIVASREYESANESLKLPGISDTKVFWEGSFFFFGAKDRFWQLLLDWSAFATDLQLIIA